MNSLQQFGVLTTDGLPVNDERIFNLLNKLINHNGRGYFIAKSHKEIKEFPYVGLDLRDHVPILSAGYKISFIGPSSFEEMEEDCDILGMPCLIPPGGGKYHDQWGDRLYYYRAVVD